MDSGHADVIVVGLGAMGSAAVDQLARAGIRVLGIDRYSPPHRYGSTHGETRITRLAIAEGKAYVPLVRRSHELWRELERETGPGLLEQIGGVIIGNRTGDVREHGVDNFLNATVAAAEAYGIHHEVLDERQLRDRFPQFAVEGNASGYYEEEAGYVRPEECVRRQLAHATSLGARLVMNETVREIRQREAAFEVLTDRGIFHCGRLVLTCGPWLGDLIGGPLAGTLTVYRQVLYWFQPERDIELFQPERLPVFIWVTDREGDLIYGFPETEPGRGVKVATEQYLEPTHPDTRVVEVSHEEIEAMQRFVVRRIPALTGPCLKAVSCLYTCTPDFRFVIDEHPDWPGCTLVSACSGHGFKHSAAIGEAVSQRIVNGRSKLDLSAFNVDRLLRPTAD